MTSFEYWQRLAAEGGRVMCAICYEGVPFEDACVDTEGQRWDMCQGCGEREQAAR